MQNKKTKHTSSNSATSKPAQRSRRGRRAGGLAEGGDPLVPAGAEGAAPAAPLSPADPEDPIIRITGDVLRASKAIKIEKGVKPKAIAAALLHFYGQRTSQAVHNWLGKYLGVETAPLRRNQRIDESSPDLFSPFGGW